MGNMGNRAPFLVFLSFSMVGVQSLKPFTHIQWSLLVLPHSSPSFIIVTHPRAKMLKPKCEPRLESSKQGAKRGNKKASKKPLNHRPHCITQAQVDAMVVAANYQHHFPKLIKDEVAHIENLVKGKRQKTTNEQVEADFLDWLPNMGFSHSRNTKNFRPIELY
jgi:hypothetical protein